MDTLQIPRVRRHSAVLVHPWDRPVLDDCTPGLDGARPKSAPPVEVQWFAQPVLDFDVVDDTSDATSDDTQSEASPVSSTESSPPSTRPSS